MEKYRHTQRTNDQTVATNKNEIRITSQGKIRNYVQYAISIFQDATASEIIIKAAGDAISKAVTVTEIIKRRVSGLHQITRIGSQTRKDTWEPREPGLESVEQSRSESWISLTLSLAPLDKKDPGYQPPLPAESVIPLEAPPPSRSAAAARGGYTRRGGRRGRGRGGSSVMFGGMPDALLDTLTEPLPSLPAPPPAAPVTTAPASTKPPKKQKQAKLAEQTAHAASTARGGKEHRSRRGRGRAGRTPSAMAIAVQTTTTIIASATAATSSSANKTQQE